MAKNEAKIKFTAETGEFNNAINKSNAEMSELRAELKLNETQMKATGTTIEGLENKHKILSEQLAASENKTEALTQKVNKAVEIFGEGSTEVTKLQTQLLNAQTAEEKLRQAIDACANELAEQKAVVVDTRTASEKLSDTIVEQEKQLASLKKQYADYVIEGNKASQEAKDLAKRISTLSSDLKENEYALSKVEKAADKLDNSLENVDEIAENVSEGFTVLKGTMAELVADGIEKAASGLVDIGTEAFTMANDMEKAMNTFVAKTGAGIEKVEEFEDVMKNIYNNNYGENFEDIADAMATVKTALGDIGDSELEKITSDALVLRDTFDMDVNESIRTVNSMMDQFGITADEAYSLIAQGAQNGLNQNDDLLDTVNEYSVQFKNAGYSAEDMFNMLANGVETGTWSVDKLGDAVKEFNIRMSDGTAKEAVEALGFSWDAVSENWSKGGDSAKEVFNMLLNELDGLETATEGYNIGVGLLGTMYEDLGQDAVLALSNVEGEISTNIDALNQINSVKYDDIGSVMEGIKRNLQTSIAEPMKNDVMPAVNEFIDDVDWTSVGETIGEVFGTVVEGAVAIADAMASAIGWMNEHKAVVVAVASVVGVLTTAITAYNVVNTVKAAMDAAQVTTVWALVAAHWAQATAAAAALAPYILIVAAIAAVIAIIVLCIKHWDDIVVAVKSAIDKVIEILGTIGSWIYDNVISPIINFFSDAWESIKGIWGGVTHFFGGIWDGITGVFANVGAWFKDKFSDSFEQAKERWATAKEAFTNIKNNVTDAFSDVGSWFKNKFAEAKENSANAWSNAGTVFSGIKDKIVNAFSGVKEKISEPFEKAKDAVKGVVDKIKGFFGFEISWPKVPMPKFKISPSGWKIGDLLEGSIPKLSITWNKDGAIFTKPTIFNTSSGLQGVAEAGAEAILPLDRLRGYVESAVENVLSRLNLSSLINAIEALASRPINLYIGDTQIATATAGANDEVNGLRTSLKNRGLIF